LAPFIPTDLQEGKGQHESKVFFFSFASAEGVLFGRLWALYGRSSLFPGARRHGLISDYHAIDTWSFFWQEMGVAAFTTISVSRWAFV
jgi:hypothetical protein